MCRSGFRNRHRRSDLRREEFALYEIHNLDQFGENDMGTSEYLNDLICTGVTKRANLGIGRRDRNSIQTHQSRYLHSIDAYSATCSG